MKRFIGTVSDGEGIPYSALREISCMKRLSKKPCKYLVKIIDVLVIEHEYYIVMEFVLGDLEKVIHLAIQHKAECIPAKEVKWLMFQILCGVDHIHSHSMAHRDLKPENILLNESLEVKIAD